MATPYMSEEDSLSDLASRIPGIDRDIYLSFRSLKIEAAFDSRIFIIYKPTGLTEHNEHRAPEILTTVRVTDFYCTSDEAAIGIRNERTGEEMDLGYVPARVFGYDVFMSIPPRMGLRWDGRVTAGSVKRSLSYPVLIKTKNPSDWFSAGNTYAETPNRFRNLYPTVPLNFN